MAKKKAVKDDHKPKAKKKSSRKKADAGPAAALERTAAGLDEAAESVKGVNVGDRAHQQLSDAQDHISKAADLLRRQAARKTTLEPPSEV